MVTVATRSRLYPDQMVTAATRIQSVSRSDGGSAPRDDLYSLEHQQRPGHLDEVPDESSAQSDFAAAWNNLLVRLARGEWHTISTHYFPV